MLGLPLQVRDLTLNNVFFRRNEDPKEAARRKGQHLLTDYYALEPTRKPLHGHRGGGVRQAGNRPEPPAPVLSHPSMGQKLITDCF